MCVSILSKENIYAENISAGDKMHPKMQEFLCKIPIYASTGRDDQ